MSNGNSINCLKRCIKNGPKGATCDMACMRQGWHSSSKTGHTGIVCRSSSLFANDSLK